MEIAAAAASGAALVFLVVLRRQARPAAKLVVFVRHAQSMGQLVAPRVVLARFMFDC